MSDIFISYAREDRARVASLAEALEGRGWSVWWDPHIPTGRRFDDVIEQAIAEARCIIVVWSASSISSDYVRAEAGEGAERGILFPVMLEEVRIPLPFRQLQTARLIDWRGEPHHPEFERLVRDISALLGPPAERPSPPAEAAEAAARSSERPDFTARWWRLLDSSFFKFALLTIGVVVAFIGLYVYWSRQENPNTNSNVVPTPTGATPTPAHPTPTAATDDESRAALLDKVKVTYLKFFRGECPPKPGTQMFIEGVKRSAFFPDTRWFLEMEHPEAARRVEFYMFGEVYDPDNSRRAVIPLPNAVIEPERTYSWQCSRTSGRRRQSAGHLARGTFYRVEIYMVNRGKDVKLYEATLEVY